MNSPAITVLMPSYNAANYIAEAIHSVLAQTFREFELLIIDDGSTDETVREIKKINDPRIRLIESEHYGIAVILNLGLKEARGVYVARFDADDVCYSDRLSIQYDFLQLNPDYILIGSEADYMDMNGEYVFTLQYRGYTDAEIRSLESVICPFSHVTVMYKKSEVIQAGGYDINAYTFEDHLLWLKLIRLGKVCNINRALVSVRFNPESVTIDEKWRGKSFNELKFACLRKGSVTSEEGDRFRKIIKTQNSDKIKRGAYYSLIAKKYLWDNYHPEKARRHLGKLMSYYPARPGVYLLYLISFLPRNVILMLYRSRPKQT